MATVGSAGLLGLVTNVGCLSAPAGGLIEAENVVCRKSGTLETRDGTKLLAAVSGTPVWGFSTADDDFYVKVNAGSYSWNRVSDSADVNYADPVLGTTAPQPFRRDVWTRADLRGNTYVPYDSGVLKLNAAGSAFVKAGLPPYVTFLGDIVSSATAPTWLANNSSVAYRLVTKRTDENGLVVRSIPSGALSFTNTSGATSATVVALVASSLYNGLFDEVEIYRTRAFTAGNSVDDEMQLVGVVPESSFVVSGATMAAGFTDHVADSARGATLYTSPSQGGITRQNDAPPAAAVVGVYKQVMFFGNVRGPFRTKFSYIRASTSLAASATGVGIRTYTGDVTNGSPTILNLSSTVGLERGMVLGGLFPSTAYVTNISGTTVTMSANATGATTVGASLDFTDAVKIDGVWLSVDSIAPDHIIYCTGAQIVYGITPAKGGYTNTWNAETISRATGTAPTIQATHGGEYDPPLPTYLGTPEAYEQEALPGVLFWSKTNEPEHVAPVNFAYVGDSAKAILGLAPTRDALYVLKEDGIWRLTGVDGNWSIDPFDPTSYCMLPTSVQPMNGRVYFLGNNGVISFGDDGLDLISKQINDLIKPVIDEIRDNFLTNGYYELNGIVGGTSSVFDREDEYTLARGSAADPLVFNEWTTAWTTFSRAEITNTPKALWTFEREGRAVYSIGSELYGTRLSTDAQLGTVTATARNDGETAITVNSYNAGAGSITASATLVALEDDVIQDAAGVLWRVTADAISSATVYVVALAESPDVGSTLTFTTGSCFVHRTIRTRVASHPYAAAANLQKRWDSVFAAFESISGPVALRFAFASSLTPKDSASWDLVAAEAMLSDGQISYPMGYGASCVMPHSHARAWAMRFGVRWVQSHGNAQLEGLYAEGEQMALRAPQQRGVT